MAQGQAKSAVFLLRGIKDKTVEASRLTTHQRRLCIRHLLDEQPELSQGQIAHILATSRQSVGRYINQVHEQDKWIVKKNDPYAWAARLVRNADVSMTKLRQQGKWFLAHKVEMDLTAELRELGVLPKIATPIKHELGEGAAHTLQEIVKRAVGTHRSKEDFAVLGRAGGGLAQLSPN